MSIGHKNPKYIGPELPLNIRQPKSLPTVTNLQQIISVLKAQQTKLNTVLQSPNVPFTPINVQAKGIAGGIEISWQSVPSPGLDGYILFKSVTADFNPVNVTRIPLPHAQLTSYIDAVGGGETFYYALVATAGSTHAPQSVLSAPSAATSATSLASGTDSNLDQIADGTNYARVLSGQLASGVVARGWGKNLCPNPGFEFNTIGAPVLTNIPVGGFVCDNWKVDTLNTYHGVQLDNVSGDAHSGIYSCKIRALTNVTIPNADNTETHVLGDTNLPIVIGDILRVSGWLRSFASVALPAGVTQSAYVALLFFDANGNQLGNLFTPSPAINTGTVKVQASLQIPATIGGGTPAYCRPLLIFNITNNSGAGFSTSTNIYECMWDDIIIAWQSTAFDLTPINTGGQPQQTSSPLTQHTSTSTQIDVAATTWQFGDGTVPYNSGSVDPGSFGTWYIYASDPTYSGGAVSYVATAQPWGILGANGYVYFGKITTVSGTVATGTGGGTGGGGAGGKASLA